MTTIGLIGAGDFGSQVARWLVEGGHSVVISNSRGPASLTPLVSELGPRARAGSVQEAARAGELVIVAIRLKHYRSLPVEPLAGKLVIDANNYYPAQDGRFPALDAGQVTSSELMQQHLAAAQLVKALNHINADELTRDGQPAGAARRRALVIAGDHASAKASVSTLFDQLGFDTVDAGALKEGWRIQPGTPGYAKWRTAAELARDLAAAQRHL
ncbi:MAG: NAD(P)-binding domain-containing protein [Polyangiales bacterium]